MLIDRAGIARLIPHAGDMCLLDAVVTYDASHIRCLCSTHLIASNPLRRAGRIGILCGVEYAAQAMALHGALAGGAEQPPRRGYLASLKALSCHVDRLDLIPGTLIVEAEPLLEQGDGMIYRFSLRHEKQVLLEGRAAVVLEARNTHDRTTARRVGAP